MKNIEIACWAVQVCAVFAGVSHFMKAFGRPAGTKSGKDEGQTGRARAARGQAGVRTQGAGQAGRAGRGGQVGCFGAADSFWKFCVHLPAGSVRFCAKTRKRKVAKKKRKVA